MWLKNWAKEMSVSDFLVRFLSELVGRKERMEGNGEEGRPHLSAQRRDVAFLN